METKDMTQMEQTIEKIKNGRGAETLGILEPLAEKGNAEALFWLGVRSLHSMRVPDNDPNSRRHYRVIRQDKKKAVELIRQSAEKDYPQALCWMAKEHFLGRRLEKNETLAFEYWKKAADTGFVPAIYKLAQCYSSARGTSLNHDEGIRLCRTAAEAGYPPAEFLLSLYYTYGRDVDNNCFGPVEPNYEKAIYWGKRAAEHGHIIGQYMMGRYYLEVKGDIVQAKYWLHEAAKRNLKNARIFLEEIEKVEVQA